MKIFLSERHWKVMLVSRVSSAFGHFYYGFRVHHTLQGLKMLFLAWKRPFWISKWPRSFLKIFLSERHRKVIQASRVSSAFVHFYYGFRVHHTLWGLKMGIFGLKTAILDFKVASELSENIFIWTAPKSYTSESSINPFRAFLLWFQGPSHTVGDNASPPLRKWFWERVLTF